MIILATQISAQFQIDRSGLLSHQEIQTSVLPAMDHDYLNSYYNKGDKNKPLRFAEPRDVEINVAEEGRWESTKSGQQIWRYKVQSESAYSINLAFSQFKLTGDSELYIYNPDKI